MKIGLDLDGVCYDFISSHRDYLLAQGWANPGELPDPDGWNAWESWGMSRERWQESFDRGVADGVIFGGGRRFLYPGTIEAVERLVAKGHSVHIITHRPAKALAATAAWLDEVGLPYDSLTLAADKTTVPVDVMVEDNVDNAIATAEAGAATIIFDRPWNRRWRLGGEVVDVDEFVDLPNLNIERAFSWEDVEGLILFSAGVRRLARAAQRMREHNAGAFDVVGPSPLPDMPEVCYGDGAVQLDVVPLEVGDELPAVAGEVRVTSSTGGQKGSKPARFDMIPPDVLTELALHYGKGEAKYPSDPETGEANWQKGYSWSLSAAALQRHLYAWLSGEDTDAETGSSHLMAVAWHAFALRWWQLHDRGSDDIAGRRVAA